jgi:predicted glycoside hydrolase/deacetylase ChbG (UPF0249 family)
VSRGEVVRVGICADDFGLSSAVDDAVLDLARHGRISATSCLVDGPAFALDAPELVALRAEGALDVGLHLNLTERFGEDAPRWPLLQLVSRAYLRGLPAQDVQREIRRQLDRFRDVLGFGPDHVDGHRHVHQFPVVRELLLRELAHSAGAAPWVRDSRPRQGSLSKVAGGERCKALAIGVLGAGRLRSALREQGIASNERLLGVYSDRCNADTYMLRLQAWLERARDGDLIMCHPVAAGTQAAAASGGPAEYAVLAGRAFPGLLAHHGVRVEPISRWAREAASPS